MKSGLLPGQLITVAQLAGAYDAMGVPRASYVSMFDKSRKQPGRKQRQSRRAVRQKRRMQRIARRRK